MAPVVALFVVLALVVALTAWTLRRRDRRDVDPGAVAGAAAAADAERLHKPLLPPTPPGIGTGV